MRHYSKLQTKGWTPERRTLQAIRVRQYKPWLRSTGPKTIEGKRKSSRNAYDPRLHTPEIEAIKSYLDASFLLLKTLARKRKQIEERRKSARRAAKKVVHIIGDCHPAFIAGAPSVAGDAATRRGMTNRADTSTIELSEQFRMATVALIH